MTSTGSATAAGSGKRGSTTRYSILSDPRLSQLFALSSQLEALAHSIDVQPQTPQKKGQQQPQKSKNTQTSSGGLGLGSLATPAISLPELPPKPFSNNNNTTATAALIQMGASMPSSNSSILKFNHEASSSNDIIISCDSSVEYQRLGDDEIENNLTEAGK